MKILKYISNKTGFKPSVVLWNLVYIAALIILTLIKVEFLLVFILIKSLMIGIILTTNVDGLDSTYIIFPCIHLNFLSIPIYTFILVIMLLEFVYEKTLKHIVYKLIEFNKILDKDE